MTSDYKNDPAFKKFIERANSHLSPMIENSTLSMTVWDGESDAKLGVELGLSILMDKPIILVVTKGVQVPHKLSAVTDEVVLIDRGSMNSSQTQKAISEAINRVIHKYKLEMN